MNKNNYIALLLSMLIVFVFSCNLTDTDDKPKPYCHDGVEKYKIFTNDSIYVYNSDDELVNVSDTDDLMLSLRLNRTIICFLGFNGVIDTNWIYSEDETKLGYRYSKVCLHYERMFSWEFEGETVNGSYYSGDTTIYITTSLIDESDTLIESEFVYSGDTDDYYRKTYLGTDTTTITNYTDTTKNIIELKEVFTNKSDLVYRKELLSEDSTKITYCN